MGKRVLAEEYTIVWVTFQFEGIHNYPEAMSRSDLADVSFLGLPHRHIFHVKAGVKVSHDNREVEFIQLKRHLTNIYNDVEMANHKSCEMLCNDVARHIFDKYPSIEGAVVTVSEDGENGATKSYRVEHRD